jgi:hypothetical protein
MIISQKVTHNQEKNKMSREISFVQKNRIVSPHQLRNIYGSSQISGEPHVPQILGA